MTKSLKRMITFVKKDWFAFVIIALGVLVQVFFVTRSLPFLVGQVLPDDAFYYFQIARHITEGAGSTFDGINPTNGYHPLWLLTLLPLFQVFSVGGVADTAPLYAALGLSVGINTLTALCILRIVTRITKNALVRAFSLAVWFLNPFVWFETLNGLETSLALFFFALFILTALRASERGSGYLLPGFIGGLMVLARLDMVFYMVAFFVWLLFRHGFKKGIRYALPAGLLTAAVVMPWFVWNYSVFQMIGTSASNANPLVNHTLIVQDNGASLFQSVKAVFYSLVYYAKDVLARTGAPWLVFVLLGAASVLVTTGKAVLPKARKHIPLLLFLFIGFMLLFIANAGIRFTGRSWYFVSANLFLVFGAAWTLSALSLEKRKEYLVLSVLALCTISTFFLGWYGLLRNQNLNQVGTYEMAVWMNENLPAGTPVGVFNAGVQAYFSDVRVINLDGLVNNSAYEAMREKKLWTYIHTEDIEYISDFDLYLTYRYKSFFDIANPYTELMELHRIQVAGGAHGANSLGIYRVLTVEEAP